MKFVVTLASKVIGYFIVLSFVLVILFKYIPVWYTPLMLTRKIDAVLEGKESKLYRDWEPYENISREMALAVVAAEDQIFPTHWGFDFDEMYNAMTEDRKKVRGASTISQQVARNVFLWIGRSYIRKGLEAWFTVLIELIWGKERILEVYLNVAETGPMTFGVEAASLRFYKKSARNLSRAEAARIAAVLPNPVKFSVRNPSPYINKRTNHIMRQMRYLGGQKYLESL